MLICPARITTITRTGHLAQKQQIGFIIALTITGIPIFCSICYVYLHSRSQGTHFHCEKETVVDSRSAPQNPELII